MTAKGPFLPYGRHLIDDDDVAAVVSVLRSDSLTGGPEVARFEEAFAAHVGARHAVACASGTAALHLAALALDLGPDDLAVVPSLTFLATANGPHYTGADVVFADVDAASGLMTPDGLAEALARAPGRPKAAFPVHLNGQSADMAGLGEVARDAGLALVEDASHAFGTRVSAADGSEARVGDCRHSVMTIFSLHPVKTIAMGEGGVITTNDAALKARLDRLRNHGMVRDPALFIDRDAALEPDGTVRPWYYEMPEPGFNYRASELHCALGRSQLAKADRFIARRRALAAAYDAALAPLAPVIRPVARDAWSDPAWHLYAVLIDFAALGLSRAALMNALKAEGIGTQVHYRPVHRQPYWRARQPGLTLPGADAYAEACLSLPLFPAMRDDDVTRVVASLRALMRGDMA